MAGLFGNATQASILGLPDQSGLGVLGAGLHDAMAYFSNHPESAGTLFPAMQQAQQQRYLQGLLAPGTPSAQAQAGSPSAPDPTFPTPSGPAPNGGVAQPSAAYTAPKLPTPTLAQAQATPEFGDLNPGAQAVYAQIPHIPGMPARQALTYYLTDPTAYQAAAAKQYDLTDQQKNISAAYGQGTPEAQAMMRGTLAKGAAQQFRAGGGFADMATGNVFSAPDANGKQTLYPQGMSGPAVMQMVPGAAQAIAGGAYAQNAGKEATMPFSGAVDANGRPVRASNLDMTGAPNVLGLPSAINGPGSTPPANLPRLGQSQAPGSGGGILPALPANQQTFMAGMGKEAQDRHGEIVSAAKDSPDRVNILDNIIQLSKQGVQTGPGSDWQNKMAGYIANAPGLGNLMAGTQDNTAKFQIMKKYLMQNAQQNWKAAGGTGTDAQLAVSQDAQPNTAQFPQAIQHLAQWVKAGELAVQAKANAQDRYIQQNGPTPENQNAFENQWRNSMDRRVFQLQAMDPQEQQQFIKGLSPKDAQTIRAKRQSLMGLGAIQ